MSANEVEFLGLEYAAKLTNKMGGNSDEVNSLLEKHWLGKFSVYSKLSLLYIQGLYIQYK